jgi:hypothetical protein
VTIRTSMWIDKLLKQNIITSAKGSLDNYLLKQHNPWFKGDFSE